MLGCVGVVTVSMEIMEDNLVRSSLLFTHVGFTIPIFGRRGEGGGAKLMLINSMNKLGLSCANLRSSYAS
jgi:hypothetical protein